MTGLNLETDRIIEVSCFVTNGALELLEPHGFTTPVRCAPALLAGMNDVCMDMHTRSGLIQRVPAAPESAEVEAALVAYLAPLLGSAKGVLSGNSVHCDLAFLRTQFPQVCALLHYRIVDVSSINEVAQRVNPRLLESMPKKKKLHTAKDDILESIAELQWYYKHFFVCA